MKLKILTMAVLLFISTTLFAEYKVIKTSTMPGLSGGQEVFFGTISDYSKKITEINKAVANGTLNGLSAGSQALARGFYGEGLKHIGAGAGIGLIVGLLDPIVMSAYADQQYILVKKSGDELVAVTFFGDKHPSYTQEQIHNILKNY